jgi:hypothetical protein
VYGIPVALGVDISPVHAMVQGSSPAWKMGPRAFRHDSRGRRPLRDGVGLTPRVDDAAHPDRELQSLYVVEQRGALAPDDLRPCPLPDLHAITHEFLAHACSA